MRFIPAVPKSGSGEIWEIYKIFPAELFKSASCWNWQRWLILGRMSFLGEENFLKIELKKAIFVGKATSCICACYWRSSRGNIAACTRTGHMHCFKINIYINGTLRNFIIVWHKRQFSTQRSCSVLMGNVCSELGDSSTSASPHGCCWVLSRPYHWCGWCYHPHFTCGEHTVAFKELAEIEH